MRTHSISFLLRLAAALLLAALAPLTQAQNVANGKLLYTAKACESCHQADIKRNADGILAGANDPNRILSECATEPEMLGFCAVDSKFFPVSRAEAVDIAAYIASEAAPPTAPAITLSATALTFTQTVGAGASGRQNLKVTNSGTANLVLSAVALAGANPGDYALLAPAAGARCQAGTTVAAAASCSVDVTFDPAVVGTRNATLVVTPAAGSGLAAVTVTLNGTATADLVPVAQADVTNVNFGSQLLNTASGAKTVVIKNTGGANLTLAAANTFVLAGGQAADFAVDATGTCKAATTLAPQATCTVLLKFTPKALGNRVATLTLKSNATDLVINLAGTGADVAAPVAAADVSTLNFGAQAINTASANRTVVISNTGTANLVFKAAGAFVLSGADAQEFDLDPAGTCAAATPVPAAGSCTLLLRFTPEAAGARVATLTVSSNATAVSVALSGAGQDGAGAAAEEDAGGCSLANPNAAFDPVLALLAVAAAALLVLRRRRAR